MSNYDKPKIKVSTKKEDQIQIKQSRKNERRYRKEKLKLKKENVFTDPIIELDKKQADKVYEFINYLRLINKCFYCAANKKPSYINLKNSYSNDNNEIIFKCAGCLNNIIDSSQQSKNYVEWFNELLKDYGMSFKDGLPSMMRYTFMETCYECTVPHEKEKRGFIDWRRD